MAVPQGAAVAGGAAGDQLALEDLVGGGAGQVGRQPDVARPGRRGQIGLSGQELGEFLRGEFGAVAPIAQSFDAWLQGIKEDKKLPLPQR